MTRPFLFDGRVCCFHPFRFLVFEPGILDSSCKPLTSSPERDARIRTLLAIVTTADGFVPMPPRSLPAPVPCSECGGSGRLSEVHCPECAGSGRVALETPYPFYGRFDCRSCLGNGVISRAGEGGACPYCFGFGTYPGSRDSDGDFRTVAGIRLPLGVTDLLLRSPGVSITSYLPANLLIFRVPGQARGGVGGLRRE
uniref:CR-type domain-containing protein n=1 Tax=Candidatus Kentrum sp. FM TaxID=2126340 RepID=A0A450RV42_9GAMM|nr:MAG: hypothetical protein BECKFM1743A_GA0114220_100034 [Candidatus Kentron sp. FM]VFJ43603.1 MAG: hypothetical protein BECKFM1743C_GA0114222_100034 [Candidatus Kentron sp. FM]VFK05632.1 MAG: hypothetical protein BECKFM1743B_GA0114221_100034 [Candidatus Kentron sp. FM]